MEMISVSQQLNVDLGQTRLTTEGHLPYCPEGPVSLPVMACVAVIIGFVWYQGIAMYENPQADYTSLPRRGFAT